ncbi:heme exporter protein CcmA [Reinekea sp. MED297]|uniref:Heme exporter protein CcmA n=2 Tax=Reinekea TaxID=230494 RepID=A4BHF4_9GAMM|nr:heme exporter protein CcmA [Reinekea sp. MED297] [Reinekea blandensis MED297]
MTFGRYNGRGFILGRYMQGIVQADKLYCERDDRVLFEQLSFAVESGEILHIKGPNGAGKTTLLRRIVGLSWVVDGTITWGADFSADGQQPDGQRFWYLAHRPAVTLQLTPLENLAFSVALHNADVDESLLWQALDTVGLRGYEDVPSGSLSAGQQRRVALSKLYLDLPDVRLWVLDEPFTALDVSAVAQLEKRIEAFADTGGSVIMTSHHGLNHTAVRELQIGVRP